MPSLETLQPEAGDDRNRAVQIERLENMYYGPSYVPENNHAGAGGIELRRKIGMPTGHLMLARSNVRFYPN